MQLEWGWWKGGAMSVKKRRPRGGVCCVGGGLKTPRAPEKNPPNLTGGRAARGEACAADESDGDSDGDDRKECHESTSVEDHIWSTRCPPHKHTNTHTQHTDNTPTDGVFRPVTRAPLYPWWSPCSRAERAGLCVCFLLTPAAVAASLRPLACPTVWFNGREGEPWAHPAPTSAIQRCGRGTPFSRYHRAIFQLSPVECVCLCVCVCACVCVCDVAVLSGGFAQPDGAAFRARGEKSARVVMMSSRVVSPVLSLLLIRLNTFHTRHVHNNNLHFCEYLENDQNL